MPKFTPPRLYILGKSWTFMLARMFEIFGHWKCYINKFFQMPHIVVRQVSNRIKSDNLHTSTFMSINSIYFICQRCVLDFKVELSKIYRKIDRLWKFVLLYFFTPLFTKVNPGKNLFWPWPFVKVHARTLYQWSRFKQQLIVINKLKT